MASILSEIQVLDRAFTALSIANAMSEHQAKGRALEAVVSLLVSSGPKAELSEAALSFPSWGLDEVKGDDQLVSGEARQNESSAKGQGQEVRH